jgi:RNA polymerase sigma-70 factor (ECF subfamily)
MISSMTLYNDNDIVASVLKGQHDDYSVLIRRHESRVRILCRSYLQDEAEADQAAQDVFVRAYENLSKFRRDSSFSTWIHRIAVNHCLDTLRRRKRRNEISLESFTDEEGNAKPLPDTGTSFESALETGDLARTLLNRLSETEREVLLMREISGLNYEEIAKTLDISIDAVKSRLKRARQSMIGLARHLFKSQNV